MTAHSNHSIEIEPKPEQRAPRRRGSWFSRPAAILLGVAALALVLLPVWRKLHDEKLAKDHSGENAASDTRETRQTPNAATVPKGERKPSVRVLELQPRPFAVQLEGLGTVTPLATVTVKSQVDGPLLSVAYLEGRDVKRGQLLAEIDPRPFRIKLAQARANVARDQAQLQNAQLDLSRYDSLLNQKLIAQQQLDAQRSQVEQLKATVLADQANADDSALQLQYTRIVSPIDGVAGIRLVDAGNLVHASDTTGIVVLTQLDPIAVVFTLPQDDLPRLSLALGSPDVKPKVLAVNRAGDATLAEGLLTVIDNQINTQTASVRLKAEFKNPERKLWPNQFVRARIEVSHQTDALLLPAAAIQHGPNGSYVYVLSAGDIAHMQPVEVTLLQGEDALIGSGLRGGERVIIEGQDQVKPNGPVSVRTQTSSTPKAKGAQ
ncbi:MAG: hypothetical protein RL701_6287 [Pseudomonadota bacterium]|jgi:multidrug efflux system membrane fusion protein